MSTGIRTFLAGLVFILGWTVSHAAKIEVIAGGGDGGPGAPAAQAALKIPFGAAFDPAGTMYVIEMAPGNRLFRVSPQGILEHVAGTGEAGFGGDDGPALSAKFNGPHNIAVLPDGNVLIADTWNGRVRKVDIRAGIASTISGFSVSPDKARSSGPYCVTLDPEGKMLYVADLNRIHAIDVATGRAKIVAGNGKKGRPEDGSKAIDAPLVDPRAVATDRKGNVYILERGGHALRVVERDGKIRTVINTKGARGLSKDGSSAADAPMSGPKHLCVDKDDTVIVADTDNHLIIRYLPREKKIRWLAGTGAKGFGEPGGNPLKCGLSQPHGVAIHPKSGEVYIADSYNNRVLKITR